jgi:dienelactone hydrolase
MKNHLIGLVLIGTVGTLGSIGTAQAQSFKLSPGDTVLAGEPLSIAIDGLAPGSEVSLHTRRSVREWDGKVVPYAASARYTVPPGGMLDLASAVPLPGGSYSGADLRGLFWSMVPDKTAPADAPAAAALPDNEVQLQLRTRKEGADVVLATQSLRFQRALPSVQTRKPDLFPGAVFAHPGGPVVKRPALILLGGSEGGALITRDAPIFASRGFAALALPYYSPGGWGPNGPTPPELPTLPPAFADIPIERLEKAREWLAQQPEVDASRIGLVGTSKGAEFALLAGVRMAWPKAILALVPTDVVWEGWGPDISPDTRSSFAWRGDPLPYVPYKGMVKEVAGFATGAEVRIRRPQDAGRAANPGRVPAARIPVEKIDAALMVVGGHDDQVWDSGGMADAIVATRKAAGRETTALIYRDAGHWLGGTGWQPTTQYNVGPSLTGGTPQGNARAQAEVFARSMEFLRRALGPMP